MLVIRAFIGLALAGALILITPCEPNVAAQSAKQETSLVAVLESIFGDQPDYMADMTIVVLKNVITQKFARKAGKARWEFSPLDGEDIPGISQASRDYKIVIISYPDQTGLGLDPQEKSYAELPDSFRPRAPDMRSAYQAAVKAKSDLKVTVENLGVETLDGHKVDKMRVSFKGDRPTQGIFFYVAKELKNLLLKMEVNDIYEDRPTAQGEKMSIALSKVSLDVPDALFQIPGEYKKVDFDEFMSTVRGKIAK
jgi:hypothetical protein